MKLLFEASEPIKAPIERVRELMDQGWVLEVMLAASGTDVEQTRSHVDVDYVGGVLGIQGQWWYRGEVSVSGSGGGTTLTYRVFNVAGRAAWAVPLANRLFIGYERGVRKTTSDLARAIETHLSSGPGASVAT